MNERAPFRFIPNGAKAYLELWEILYRSGKANKILSRFDGWPLPEIEDALVIMADEVLREE